MQPQSGPIAILAGSGRFPELLADTLRGAGRACRILAFRGFANSALRRRADAAVDLLDVKRVLACLREWAPSAVTLAGTAVPITVATLSGITGCHGCSVTAEIRLDPNGAATLPSFTYPYAILTP